MKPKQPRDLLYLTILSSIVSGVFTGGLYFGWWLYQEVSVWWAIFFLIAVIVWMVEVNKDD